MEEWVIAELVGAAGEEFEWTAFFLGETDERSLTIWVSNLFVPQTQVRGRGHVRIPDDFKLPHLIAPEVVGIVHLHPGVHIKSRVGFSSVDTGAGGLNERWPMSMVVALTMSDDYDEVYSMGISYEIKGKCVLPCGALGIVDYFLHPSLDGVPDPEWPWPRKIVEPTIKKKGVKAEALVEAEHADLEDCSKYTEGEDSTRYMLRRIASCGLVETATWPRPYVFGATGGGILDRLPKAYREPQERKGKGNHKHNGRTYVEQYYPNRYDKETGRLLPGWSETREY